MTSQSLAKSGNIYCHRGTANSKKKRKKNSGCLMLVIPLFIGMIKIYDMNNSLLRK